MAHPTDVERIYEKLHGAKVGALCTLHQGAINSRFMLYACDRTLRRFYMLTHHGTDKIEELTANSQATLCVLCLPPDGSLDESCEATVLGRAAITGQFGGFVPEALKLLAEKSPQVSAMLDAEALGGYRVIRLDVAALVFRTYQEALVDKSKTILRFAS